RKFCHFSKNAILGRNTPCGVEIDSFTCSLQFASSRQFCSDQIFRTRNTTNKTNSSRQRYTLQLHRKRARGREAYHLENKATSRICLLCTELWCCCCSTSN
ncbi:unnamed protein product, partial [Scytosiphon promiscuus]